jgi:hypothetical protein
MVFRRTKAKKIKREIPFSWALLFISILEISVWSIGLREDPVKEYFIRENLNVRTNFQSAELVKPVSEKSISLFAFLEQQIRISFRQAQELRNKRVLESDKSVPRKAVQLSTSFTVFLPGSQEQETQTDPDSIAAGIVF